MAPVEKLWGHLLCPFETCPAAGWGSEGFTALFPLREAQIPVLQFVETLGTHHHSRVQMSFELSGVLCTGVDRQKGTPYSQWHVQSSVNRIFAISQVILQLSIPFSRSGPSVCHTRGMISSLRRSSRDNVAKL
jgi:hypothetical protein